MGGFCPDSLWSDVLWSSTSPRMSQCLADTLPVYLPSIILLVSAPFMPKEQTSSRTSLLHRLRQLLLLLLLLSTLTELLLLLLSATSSPVTTVSSLTRLLTNLLASWLYHQSSPTSIPLFLYWLLASSCSLLRLLSLLPVTPSYLPSQATELSLLLSLLLSSFLSEPAPPSPPSADKDHTASPESHAPAPSRLLFSWVSPLTWRGWRGGLTTQGMWALTHPNS